MRIPYLASIVIFTIAFPIHAEAAHEICQTPIAGVALNSSPTEAHAALSGGGLADVTCAMRSKLGCADRKKQGATFSNNGQGHPQKPGDQAVTLFFHQNDGHVYYVLSARGTRAPNTLEAYDKNRSWDGWSEADLIQSKINEYCKAEPPEGVNVSCNYRSGVDITVLVGSRRNQECKYNFEARFAPGRGDRPASHSIRESLTAPQ